MQTSEFINHRAGFDQKARLWTKQYANTFADPTTKPSHSDTLAPTTKPSQSGAAEPRAWPGVAPRRDPLAVLPVPTSRLSKLKRSKAATNAMKSAEEGQDTGATDPPYNTGDTEVASASLNRVSHLSCGKFSLDSRPIHKSQAEL
eukprot:gene102-5513_t